MTPRLRRTVGDGLRHRVRYTLTLRAENAPQVLLTEVLTTEVHYDLWDEAYIVRHEQAGRARSLRVKKVDKLPGILEKPRFRTMVPLASLDGAKRYRVEVVAEVDPVSQDVLDRTREMLSPPPGDSETHAARSFLGSVARIFVNEDTTSPGGEALSFRSQPFAVPREGVAP
jgi:hypothetical protein